MSVSVSVSVGVFVFASVCLCVNVTPVLRTGEEGKAKKDEVLNGKSVRRRCATRECCALRKALKCAHITETIINRFLPFLSFVLSFTDRVSH